MNAERQRRVVLVTGAAGDIGAEIARQFLALGDTVHLSDLPSDALSDRAAALSDLGPVTHSACDLADGAAVDGLARDVLERHGRVDVLVNNAAIQHEGGIDTCTPEDLDRSYAINLRAPLILARGLVGAMQRAGGGAIVNISSVHATAPGPNRLAYATTKTGLLGLTRSLAVDLGADNIRVNAVSPGATLTEQLRAVWLRQQDGRIMAQAERQHPMGRIAAVEDVAEAVVFLAGAAFVTGTELRVDGGFLSALRLLPKD